MASRLSEETMIRSYDLGHVPLTREHLVDLMMGPPVDLDAALNAKNPKKAIRAIAPQPLYFALMHRGLEDSLDVLELVSRSQFVRLMDYTAWRADRLSVHKVFDWLGLYSNLGREQVYERFRQLDEEYQLAVMGPYIEMFDEEAFEALKDYERDDLTALPCNTLHYRIKTTDKKLRMAIEDLIQSALEGDVGYAYSLLAHAAHMPPTEQEALIAQFRTARLEEDGFVTREESLRLFRPIDLSALEDKWRVASAPTREGLVAAPTGKASGTLERVLEAGVQVWDQPTYETLTRGFLSVANALCAATDTEPDDENGLRRILTHSQAMVSLALEHLIGDDIQRGTEVVSSEHPQLLFRAGLTLVHRLQTRVIRSYEFYDLPQASQVRKYGKLGQNGRLLYTFETALDGLFDYRTVETLKGLFNRFPVRPETITQRDDGSERIIFSPIDSLQSLAKAGEEMDRLFGLIHIANSAREGDWIHVEEILTTALARVTIGQEFRCKPLKGSELQACLDLSRDAYESLMRDFYQAAEEMLRLQTAKDAGWVVSEPGQTVTPIQSAMAAFSDVVMEFSLNRERVRETQGKSIPQVLMVEEG